MGVVAGQAGKLPVAFAETRGRIQIGRLMADVPGVRPIVFLASLGRLAVAYSTVLIEFGGVELLGIANGPGRAARHGVGRSRPVAGLAVHARLRGTDGIPGTQGGLSRGVAAET